MSCKNNIFKTSAPTWIEEFKLPDGSCSVLDIQDYLEYIFKDHEKKTDNASIRIDINIIENRITFKFHTRYHLDHLTPTTMKLFRSVESKITKDKNSENVPHLEIAEVVFVHYQQD